ncbi:methyltransferase-like protein 2 isoform X3 [Dioscorea cayenensis subsp. rotundata]|uniref:Methyltransferase-like protein 2 isoform X3 n=1 Tax=Dioscorea cayennensis subsp. rotundata TaxID=55577 RepID=A0AB40AYH5_DIOCR|nr:methyltransferase-like protein 2 isoform X3 [Dioscorea cayenensis subsp. rotundata]
MEYDVHDELLSFMSSGIYRFSGSNVVFVDPVRVLSNSYSRFRINSAGYYSRFFGVPSKGNDGNSVDSSSSMKNKKRKRNSQSLNEREKSAENRHQNARPFLVSAYESFQRATDLLHFLPSLLKEDDSMPDKCDTELNFIELGSLWQAPLYEISLSLPMENIPAEGGSQPSCCEGRAVPVFNNLIRNQSSYDLEADFLNRQYILPGKCRFFMSDLRRVHDLIPAQPDYGYNLIIIDPPWENGSVYQKAVYPTLPNRYLLYLPIKQLAHIDGALVVLWITNREKLRAFVEDELFPAWGVADISEFFWLKVKPDGSLIGELDLFHHRPYECLLLGYINAKAQSLQDVLIYLLENWWLAGLLGVMNLSTFKIQSTFCKEAVQSVILMHNSILSPCTCPCYSLYFI